MKSRKILLIHPPFFRLFGSMNNRISLQLHALAEHIKLLGHHAVILNADSEPHEIYSDWASIARNWGMYDNFIETGNHVAWTEEIPKVIAQLKPDAVIVGAGDIIIPTVDVGSLAVAKITAEVVRRHTCSPIIGYGPLVTFSKEQLLHLGAEPGPFDLIIKREGEMVIESIIDNLDGFQFSSNSNDYIINGGITAPSVLEQIPFLKPETIHGEPISPINFDYISSERGCPFSCSFCLSPAISRRLRAVTPKKLVDEMQFRLDTMGTENFYITDLTFTANKKRVKKICDEIVSRGLPIKWHCESRVDTINQELLNTMAQAGCTTAKYGVEVGTQKMLDELNKGTTLQQARDAVEMTRKAGMNFVAYVFLGTPTATPDDYFTMYEFLDSLKADHYVINVAAPHEGTTLNKEMGGEVDSQTISKLTHLSHDMLKHWNLTSEIVEKFMSLGKRKEDSGYRKYVPYEERQKLINALNI